MTESAVVPSQNLDGIDPSSAFADALQRARQIAAKISTPGTEGNGVGGTKRPHEDSNDMEWGGEQNATKKIASLNDPIGAQLAAMQQQQRLGVQSNSVMTITYHVPNKMVGLIIGRGGENITRLQSESGCTIQMSPAVSDSGGLPKRSCTLTGTKAAIDKAQEMISEIVNRDVTNVTVDPSGPMVDGGSVVEVMIPASKVGLIIGKGGETIKSLQERADVKMVMIQDGKYSDTDDKPLCIKGEFLKINHARQLVMELLADRDQDGRGRGGDGGFNRNQSHKDYGSGQNDTEEVAVPRQAVGVVIGKGGETVKKIQQDSGARVQFQPDDGSGDRMCFLSGTPEQIQQAQEIIHELIGNVLARDQQNMGRGRGRGRGGGGGYDDRRGGGRGGGGNDYMGNQGWMGGRGGPPDGGAEASYTVPAEKCGIVIGKGGETIRAISQQAGAHVELSRNAPPNPAEKLFIIRGLPSQIEHAKQLISEKVGGRMNEVSNSGGPPSSGPYGMTGGNAQPQGPYGQTSQQPQGPQGYTPQGWGGAYQHWQAQPAAPGVGGAADPSKQAVDANAAAWAAYYAQYAQYTQAGQTMAAQPAAPGQQPAVGLQPAAPTSQAGAAAQPDYSTAWADYYRAMGMYQQAEMIEQQARAGQQPTGPQQGAPAQVAAQPPAAANPQAQQPSAVPATQPNQSTAQPGQPPYSQYGQYPQQGPFPYSFSAQSAQPQ